MSFRQQNMSHEILNISHMFKNEAFSWKIDSIVALLLRLMILLLSGSSTAIADQVILGSNMLQIVAISIFWDKAQGSGAL